MGNDDDADTTVVHRGDKVVTVSERFDMLEKRVNWLTYAVVILIAVHFAPAIPILEPLLKGVPIP